MRFLDHQRRKHANDIVARRNGQDAPGSEVGDKGPAVGLHLDAEHQAEPANAFEKMVVIGDHLLERGTQPITGLAHPGEEFGGRDHVEHCHPGGHRKRIAAIGRPVGSSDHSGRSLFGREAGAERKSAADPLGGRQYVGNDPILLVGVERAGARHPALDLVEDQAEVMLVADIAEPRQEFAARRTDPALALNGLDQKARGVRPDRRPGSLQIVECDHAEAFEQRREAVAKLGLVGRADRRHRPPVKGVGEGNQFVLVWIARDMMIAARNLDRAFDRLGARIGEEHRVGKRELGQSPGKLLALGRSVEVGDVHQRRGLALDRTDQVRVAMTEQIDRDPAGEVEIALAALADQVDALALDRPNLAARVDGHERSNGHWGVPFRSKSGSKSGAAPAARSAL